MSEDEARGSTRGSVRLPATLLLIMIVAICGGILWLTEEPPAKKPSPPTANIDLAPAAAQSPPKPAPAAAPSRASDVASEPPAPGTEHGTPDRHPPTTAMMTPSPSETHPAMPRQGQTEAPAGQSAAAERAEVARPATKPGAPVRNEPPSAAAPPATEPAPPATTVVQSVAPVIPRLPRVAPSRPLAKAPDPGLIEDTPRGRLPTVGRDGREAWRVYARPFDQNDKRPRIAVVIYGLGSSASATRAAIQGLPGAVTLAFTPYADDLLNWIADARAAGHETLLMVPMEPKNYPDFDPGPQALLTSANAAENTERLEWMMGRGAGYVGVTDFMGSRFTGSPRHMRAFLQNLRKRGLLFLESRPAARVMTGELATALNVPFAANMLYVDSRASRAAIDAQLQESERLAGRLGTAVIMGYVYPVTLERVGEWASKVERRGFALAPVSALAVRKEP